MLKFDLICYAKLLLAQGLQEAVQKAARMTIFTHDCILG